MTEEKLKPIKQPEYLGQTFLKHFVSCPRSAYLYVKHRDDPSQIHLTRGIWVHEVLDRAVKQMIITGEVTIPWEITREILKEVAQEDDLIVPPAAWEEARVSIFHWSEHFELDPSTVIALETTVILEVIGVKLRGRIDLSVLDGVTLGVKDYKTQMNLPSQEEFEKDFQQKFYGTAAIHGHTPEGDKLVQGPIQYVETEGIFLRMEPKHGLVRRHATYDVRDMVDHLEYLELVVEKVLEQFEKQEWPARPGTHCSICPASNECPLPANLRPDSPPDTVEEAQKLGEAVLVAKKEQTKARGQVKAAAIKNGGELPVGADKVFNSKIETRRSVNDWDELLEAIEDAARYGEPLDLSAHVKETTSQKWDFRTIEGNK